jgi:hypothetical protein
MNKGEAQMLREAVHLIEIGKVDEGVTKLRDVLRMSGYAVPALVRADFTRPPRGKER